jgi:hypothetical protein
MILIITALPIVTFLAGCLITHLTHKKHNTETAAAHQAQLDTHWRLGWDGGWKSASEDAGHIHEQYHKIFVRDVK